MSLPLRVRLLARRDLREARDWYDRQAPGLGQEFVLAVQGVFEHIRQQPELHAVVENEYRRVRVPRFKNFYVYYRIDKKEIVITAVLHAARDPSEWKSRP